MTASQNRKTRKHLKHKKGGVLPGQPELQTNSGVTVAAPVSPPPPIIPPPANVVQSSAPVQPAPAQRGWSWWWPFGSKSGGSRRTHRKRASRHKTHRKHNK